ncbi:anthranilate synthase component I [Halalkalicoccus sp. NIPERK01]|uniref:anthranilate synthase component I n=1 Tax=Halalkalicoccus sp. NIPERK01 TaxID=3053469 RepID=UPI00256F1181|nr:anthranilate synthase component I [Halalkalicoccus sp. NIPERK01]MDL5362250.1 anthranilate synthase component I [Halalkalicoccus sp. NIPERK01]
MIDRGAFRERASVEEPSVVHVGADLDAETTPLTAYAALGTEDGFLLESAEKVASSDPDGAFQPASASATRHARYSFVGYDPEAVVTVRPDSTTIDVLGDERLSRLVEPNGGDTLDTLREALPAIPRIGFPDDGHLHGGLVGFLAYDAVYDLWLSEVGIDRPESGTPDAQFVLSTKTLVFDEVEGTLSLSLTPIVFPEDDPDDLYDALREEVERVRETLDRADEPETGGFVREDERAGPREEYEEVVRETKEHVLNGDIYQGVLSRKRELVGRIDPLGLYEALREINPSPYMYLLGYGERTVVGASPETLISVRDGLVTSNPIAGTCSRGSSPVEDRRLAGEMLADDKERAEHTMLVDLARNDVRRVSKPGSVRVEEFMNVLKYSHVQHIESTVTGELVAEGTSAARRTESFDAFDATRAAFPAGTLSGAPKIRAMEIIDALEGAPRGIYGGGVGYYSWTGDADTAIAIRTATIEHGERDRITVQAGAGLVADSDPAAEYEETEKKMGGVIEAIERIETEPEEVLQ